MNIHTLTANPSVDFYLEVSKIVPEDINRLAAVRKDVGGKGINVARVLKDLGGESTALGFVAGENGRWISDRLDGREISHRFEEVSGESRAIYNILEKRTGRIYRFNESGPVIPRNELKRLKDYLFSQPYEKGSFFAVCGSAPPGIPPDFYASLISHLKKKGLFTLLDSDNQWLIRGVKACPDIIKPNLFELSRLVGRRVGAKLSDVLSAARKVISAGIGTVIVSLGEGGAVAVTAGAVFQAEPPRLKARSTIGAGDALTAGFLAGISGGKSLADALRLGVAAGAASVLYPGTSFAPADRIRSIHRRVRVRQIS